MTRRKIILGAVIGSAVLGVAVLVGIAGHYAIPTDDDDDDDDGRDAVARASRFAKVSLQQGLTTGEQEGQPISGKFEVDRGKLGWPRCRLRSAPEGRRIQNTIKHWSRWSADSRRRSTEFPLLQQG